MNREDRNEIIFTISSMPDYSGYIRIKLIEHDKDENNRYVDLYINHPIQLNELMISDLITALEKASVFLRQDPP